jgi:hypothetical protein
MINTMGLRVVGTRALKNLHGVQLMQQLAEKSAQLSIWTV